MLGEKVAPFPAFPQGRNTRETVPAASFFSRSRKFSRKCLFCVFHDRLAEKGTFRPSENQLRGGARGKRRSPARADAGRPDAGNGDAARHLHAAPRRRVPHRSLPRSRRRRTPPRHLPPRRRHHGNGRRNRETLPRAGHLEGRALPEPHRSARSASTAKKSRSRACRKSSASSKSSAASPRRPPPSASRSATNATR